MRYDEHSERVRSAIIDRDVDYIYQALIDDEYFTENELDLLTGVNGYSYETLNDACEYRFSEDIEQLYDIDFDDEEDEEDEDEVDEEDEEEEEDE